LESYKSSRPVGGCILGVPDAVGLLRPCEYVLLKEVPVEYIHRRSMHEITQFSVVLGNQALK
jgi:hypothetical protein